jgi:AAA domain
MRSDNAMTTAARDDGARATVTVCERCYREHEKARILAALLANSSLLVVSGPGMGKSTLAKFVAEELRGRGFHVAVVAPRTGKQFLVELAEQLGCLSTSLASRIPTSAQLQSLIADDLSRRTAFLLFDDAHRLPVSMRAWLEELLAAGVNMALLATHPPKRDVFLKMGRIELKPLDRQPIREVMAEAARELGLDLAPSKLSQLAERCGGNPMLARRVVREEHLGLDETAPDHTDWIDGTPLLIAGLMIFAVLRFIGRGLHSTDLYLLGGILTVAVGVMRVLIMSLPRATNRIGQ